MGKSDRKFSPKKFLHTYTPHRCSHFHPHPDHVPGPGCVPGTGVWGQVASSWPTEKISRWRKEVNVRQSGVSAETRRQGEAPGAQKERSTLDRGSGMGTAP